MLLLIQQQVWENFDCIPILANRMQRIKGPSRVKNSSLDTSNFRLDTIHHIILGVFVRAVPKSTAITSAVSRKWSGIDMIIEVDNKTFRSEGEFIMCSNLSIITLRT